jgi:hypothetical protein
MLTIRAWQCRPVRRSMRGVAYDRPTDDCRTSYRSGSVDCRHKLAVLHDPPDRYDPSRSVTAHDHFGSHHHRHSAGARICAPEPAGKNASFRYRSGSSAASADRGHRMVEAGDTVVHRPAPAAVVDKLCPAAQALSGVRPIQQCTDATAQKHPAIRRSGGRRPDCRPE